MVFAFLRRSFLNPTATGETSYILAEAESSFGGENRQGHYMLTIADCYRRISLHFELYNARDRRRSLAKINLLIEVLTQFRDALKREADLIDKYKS